MCYRIAELFFPSFRRNSEGSHSSRVLLYSFIYIHGGGIMNGVPLYLASKRCRSGEYMHDLNILFN